MADRAYADPAYRAALAVLRADVHVCVWCRTARATSPDHVPPLAVHDHVPGSGCCRLLPACRACNYRRGAALGNRRRSRQARARLAPGSGMR